MLVGGSGESMREYRKGNWTVNETLTLIRAKKMDDERRMKKESGGEGRSSRPAELRWKWVEDYCWRNGCMRSQNQCNDKWDNLMRDYKKVREHEKKVSEGRGEGSYWKLERHERKDRNLPTNLLPEIYEALVEVVEKRGNQKVRMHVPNPNEADIVGEKPLPSIPSSIPLLQQHTSIPSHSQPLQQAQPLLSLAQILMGVSIQAHLQRGEEEEEEEKGAAALMLPMTLLLQSPRVHLFYQKHYLHVRKRKREGTQSF